LKLRIAVALNAKTEYLWVTLTDFL